MAEPVTIWRPQPGPQAQLVCCPIADIFYGGSRGGGKTDGMIGKNAIKAERYGKTQKGIFFRRELPQLEAAIERCKELYLPVGWKWAEQKKTFTSPKGSILKFRPLERDSDAEKYQGHDYTDVYFEELTNYPSPKPVDKLRGTLRSGAGVPCQMHATGNPGGPGHNWVKDRYIDPAPMGWKILVDEHGNQRVFIPAKLTDNKMLTDADPGYVGRLRQTGSEELVRAWLEGDWSVIEGAFFDCWHSQMVIPPFEVPESWAKFRSFDWGSARPFSVGWWAIVQDDYRVGKQLLPRGALVRYREWYGRKTPNVGIKLTSKLVAKGILERETEKVMRGVADPSIFAHDDGPSIAEKMMDVRVDGKRCIWIPADNKRVAREGQIGGWAEMRQRMIGTNTITDEGDIIWDGRSMIYCFSTCADSIRTIPVLQHDKNKAEDVDTESEDHAADEWRYACMSRPWSPPKPVPATSKQDRWNKAFDDDEVESWKVA